VIEHWNGNGAADRSAGYQMISTSTSELRNGRYFARNGRLPMSTGRPQGFQ